VIFSAILHALTAALLAMHPVEAPAPHGITVSPVAPAPRVVAPAPSRGGAPAGGAPAGVPAQRPASPATVAEPETAAQLPDEVIGREENGPDGAVCTVTDAAGDMACAPGAPARP